MTSGRFSRENRLENGRFLKHIEFRFPVFFEGEEITGLSWDNATTVKSIVLLAKNP